jgi:hypothetical protein
MYRIHEYGFSIGILVQNRKVWFNSDVASVLTQNIRTEGMKGGKQHTLTAIRNHLLDTRTHLGRGLYW